MPTFDSHHPPTRTYNSGVYPPASTRTPANLRRDYEAPADINPAPPRRPPTVDVSGFAVSAACIVAGAGALMWLLVTVTNRFLPAPAAGTATFYRDPIPTAIGAAALTFAAAGLLVGLIYRGSRPGLIFPVVTIVGGLVITAGQGLVGTFTNWQAWISTGLVNIVVLVAAVALLCAVGRGSINDPRRRRDY